MNRTTFFSLDNFTWLKRTALLCAIWLLVSLILSFARITHPAFGFQGDVPIHYHVTRSLARSVEEGDLLPRWAGLLDGGKGDAWFTFYPPLSYLLSVALMKLLGIGVLTSMKLVTVLLLIIAQAAAYCFARAFFDRRNSMVASLFYVALPAFPLIALKTSLFANAFALSLVPLALFGANELLTGRRRTRGWIVLTLSMSAIVLSHVITTYLCSAAIALLMLIHLPKTGWRGPARLAGAGLLVFALTAFFLVPQLVEMSWVRVDLQVERHDYRNYFLFAKPKDNTDYRQMWAGFNTGVSILTLAQTSLTFLFFLACLPLLRRRNRLAAPALLGAGLAAFALVISLSWFEAIWRFLPGLKYVQFPWRFLPFVSLGCGLIVAAAYAPQEGEASSWRMLKPIQRAGITLVMVWIVIANFGATWVLSRVDQPEVTDEQVTKLLLGTPDLPKISDEESNRLDFKNDWLYVAYTGNNPYYRPVGSELDIYPRATQPGGLTLLSGRGRIVTQRLHNERREFLVQCEEPVRARLETYAYPHWIARLDEREIKIDTESGTGLMLIDLPAGAHKLDVSFEPRNRMETWASRVSLLAWASFIGWIIWRSTRPLSTLGR